MDYMAIIQTALNSVGYNNVNLLKKPKFNSSYNTLPVVLVSPFKTNIEWFSFEGHQLATLEYQLVLLNSNSDVYATNDGAKDFFLTINGLFRYYTDDNVYQVLIESYDDFNRVGLGEQYDASSLILKFLYLTQ